MKKKRVPRKKLVWSKSKRKLVDNLVKEYQAKFVLQDWDIKNKFEEKQPENKGLAADANVRTDYLDALITWYPETLNEHKEDKDGIKKIVRHELCHIITQELLDLCHRAFKTNVEVTDANERATERISRLVL